VFMCVCVCVCVCGVCVCTCVCMTGVCVFVYVCVCMYECVWVVHKLCYVEHGPLLHPPPCYDQISFLKMCYAQWEFPTKICFHAYHSNCTHTTVRGSTCMYVFVLCVCVCQTPVLHVRLRCTKTRLFEVDFTSKQCII